MAVIRILDTHTINKIAAGEVVERPCSVVKELVENSVDAKASSITVEIKNGGIDLIRVTDNGIGIPKDQVEVAFLRHATSKITQAEDLYEVTSLGFRGEALASIAAVSHVELFTKVKDDTTGKRVEVSGGKLTAAEEVACPEGTTFIMRHLFYNVPARKAFLMSSGTEAGKISDYMYKLALAHPEIAFKYIQNGKAVFNTSGDHELKHCVLNIYGKEYARHTFKCYYKENDIECVGLLGEPTLNRSNRNYEHFFINGRYIKSQILQNAVEDAYKTLMMVGKFPFVVLHLYMDPSLVDVNVHPTKLQVRFKHIDLIQSVVYTAVSQAIKEQVLVPDVNMDKPRGDVKTQHVIEQMGVDTFFTPRKENNKLTAASLLKSPELQKQHTIPEENPYKPSLATIERLFGPKVEETKEKEEHRQLFRCEPAEEKKVTAYKGTPSSEAASLENRDNSLPNEKGYPIIEKAMIKEEAKQRYLSERAEGEKKVSAEEPLPKAYRIIGQIFKTYWLVQYHEKVMIIDQHAAHERVLYEQFMAYFKSGHISTQLLLMPETLNVTSAEMALLEENKALFTKLGFIYEPFGEHAIAIREVPYLLNEPLSVSAFKEVLDEMQDQKIEHLADVKAESIIRMSCRSAIKGHDQLSEMECHSLIDSLMSLENPFTCPHGRPTIVALGQGDIEKMFKRI